MKISESDYNFLMRWKDEIETQLKIKIGYSSVFGSFVDDEDEFIIYEEGKLLEYPDFEIYNYHLLSRKDFQREYSEECDFLVEERIKNNVDNDSDCEDFLNRIYEALSTNSLIANKEHKKEFKDFSIDIVKLGDGRYSINIKNDFSTVGFSNTYSEILKSNLIEHKEEILQTISELEKK